MKQRKGYGIGKGMGYKNLMPMDSYIHSLSAKGVKSRIIFLNPTNEGQDLNYVETHRGNFNTAQIRAEQMKRQLIKAMPQGSIRVSIQDQSGNELMLKAKAKKSLYARAKQEKKIEQKLRQIKKEHPEAYRKIKKVIKEHPLAVYGAGSVGVMTVGSILAPMVGMVGIIGELIAVGGVLGVSFVALYKILEKVEGEK